MASSREACLNLTNNPTLLKTVHISRDAARGNMVIVMKKQMFRERECIHRDGGAEGEFYNGVFYIQALQRLRVNQAVEVAGRVSSFFWSDAPHIIVWLCEACAGELRLNEVPRAVTSAARRQA